MSHTAYFNTDVLSFRSRRSESSRGNWCVPAGLKRHVKRGLAKVSRAQGKRSVVQSLTTGVMSIEAAEEQVILRPQAYVSMDYDDVALAALPVCGSLDDELPYEPSLLEQASLPDWMLEMLEASNGSSFEHLTLFEQRERSRAMQFAASADDEGLASYLD